MQQYEARHRSFRKQAGQCLHGTRIGQRVCATSSISFITQGRFSMVYIDRAQACVCVYVCMYVCMYVRMQEATAQLMSWPGTHTPFMRCTESTAAWEGDGVYNPSSIALRVLRLYWKTAFCRPGRSKNGLCTTFALGSRILGARPLEEHSAYCVCTRNQHFGGPATRRAFRVLSLYTPKQHFEGPVTRRTFRVLHLYSKTAL